MVPAVPSEGERAAAPSERRAFSTGTGCPSAALLSPCAGALLLQRAASLLCRGSSSGRRCSPNVKLPRLTRKCFRVVAHSARFTVSSFQDIKTTTELAGVCVEREPPNGRRDVQCSQLRRW